MKSNGQAYFPLFVDLSEKKIVVIGAGKIASRRIGTLSEFTRNIVVVAPRFEERVLTLAKEGRIQICEKKYEREDLYGADIVIAGTDDEGLNEDIYSVCKCLGILVNVISDRTKCDFHFPGIVKRDTLVAGVNAGGRDHSRAKRARQAIEKALDDFTGGRITMAAPEKFCVGSRESKLAVIQSEMVISYIKETCPETEVSLLTMKTTGDIILDRTLDKVGGKGLFVKELDKALLDRRSDLSVHSLKDMPMEVPDELPVVAFSKREDPRDVLVLPQGAKKIDFSKPVGCSSLRRILQLRELFPQAEFKSVRGNVITRLAKLDSGEYSALVLAAAGLKRLGLAGRINRYFEPEEIIPSAGQGILALQGRAGEDYSFLEGFSDPDGTYAALAERAFVRYLDGGCSSPVAAHAVIEDKMIRLTGLYYKEETGEYIKGSREGSAEDAELLGEELARELKEKLEG